MNEPRSTRQNIPKNIIHERPSIVPAVRHQSGAALFWPGGDGKGWDHPPLYLPSPVLIIRVNRYGTHVETPDGERVAYHEDKSTVPFQWMDEIFDSLYAGDTTSGRRLFVRPVFPIAVFSMAWEYGRFFHPLENCFPHASAVDCNELFISFHCTGFTWVDGGWKIAGRRPSSRSRWRDWKIPQKLATWPTPNLPLQKIPRTDVQLDPAMKTGFSTPQMSFDNYRKALEKIHQHLRNGDIYQANMTVQFLRHTRALPEEIFKAAIDASSERYSCLIQEKNRTHISFSPELLLRRWGNRIITKPIKGTAPMKEGDDLEKRTRELRSSKNIAEHVMIVDLERNDFGKVCATGSIRVDPLMKVNEHPNLLHLESTVTGTMEGHRSFRDLLSRIFPGGSVSGAPKKRALEIIGELETHPRGVYCGAMGWIDKYGDCDLNLPIRTATWSPEGRLAMNGGGGIVADSDPEMEWEELKTKLSFMENAISAAEKNL